MKKNISVINLDSSTTQWFIEKLKAAPAEVKGVDKLLEALTELQTGTSSSLVLEMNQTGTALVSDRISYGALTIFPSSRKVLRDEMEVALTPKEFDILLFLVRNRGEVFTKEQIYQAVWEEEYLMDDSNIMAFIRKLRKKIEPNPDAPKYILTIWGIGYKFNDTMETMNSC